jgi:BMFP domain-containing protein YqiC
MSDTNTDYTGRFDRLERSLDDSFSKIERRFKEIDRRFEQVNQRFEKVDDQLNKLTTAMVKGFDRIDKELEKKANKVDLNRALNMLDAMIKRQEVDNQERLVMSHHVERIERWSHELAGKIGHKLTA